MLKSQSTSKSIVFVETNLPYHFDAKLHALTAAPLHSSSPCRQIGIHALFITFLFSLIPSQHSIKPTLQTKWFGSRKFGIPSCILYSWAQFPHTSAPSLICVSKSSVCSSFIIFLSASSSSTVGAAAGSWGKPSYTNSSARSFCRGGGRRGRRYLHGSGREGGPVYARQDVVDERGVGLNGVGDELAVFGVQGE